MARLLSLVLAIASATGSRLRALSGIDPNAPLEGAWEPIKPLPFARSDHSVTVVGDLLYIAGGCDGAQDCDASIGFCSCTSITADFIAYDPAADRYIESLPNLPAPRYRHEACAFGEEIFFFGGRSKGSDAIERELLVYNTRTATWAVLGNSATPAAAYPADLGSDNTCITLGDNIYVMGGYSSDYSVSTNVTYAFSPATRTWTRKAGQLNTGRGDFTGVAIGGFGYVFGGYTSADFCQPIDSVEEYDPVADAWRPRAPMVEAIAEKDDGIVLGDRFFSVGGEKKAKTVGCTDFDITPVVEVQSYHPPTDTWRNETGWPLPEPFMRFGGAAWNGAIFIFGGQGPVRDGEALPLKYVAYAFRPGGAPGGGGGGDGGEVTFSRSDMIGAVIGTALVTLFLVGVGAGLRRACGRGHTPLASSLPPAAEVPRRRSSSSLKSATAAAAAAAGPSPAGGLSGSDGAIRFASPAQA